MPPRAIPDRHMERRKTKAREAWLRLGSVRGTKAKLARLLRLSTQTTDRWKMVPPEYVFAVAEACEASVLELRPDVFWNDPLRGPAIASRDWRRHKSPAALGSVLVGQHDGDDRGRVVAGVAEGLQGHEAVRLARQVAAPLRRVLVGLPVAAIRKRDVELEQ